MEEAIRALLLATTSVTAIVGTRINFGQHPQGHPYPALVINTVSDFEGYLTASPDGLFDARIQVDAYDMGYGPTKLLSRAVQTALSGYRGGKLQGVFHEGSRDISEGGSNEAQMLHRVALDFTVRYTN